MVAQVFGIVVPVPVFVPVFVESFKFVGCPNVPPWVAAVVVVEGVVVDEVGKVLLANWLVVPIVVVPLVEPAITVGLPLGMMVWPAIKPPDPHATAINKQLGAKTVRI